MTYTPNPTSVSLPNAGISAGTADLEFQALKQYIISITGGYNFRNKLLNGSFIISQALGLGNIVVTNLSGLPYVADCWFLDNTSSGGNITASSTAAIVQGSYSQLSLVFDATASSCILYQRIEANRVADLVTGTSITISGYIEVDSLATTPTLSINLNAANAGNNFGASTSVGGVVIPITLVAASAVYFQTTLTLSGNAYYGLEFQIIVGNATNRTLEFTLLQLEANAFQTPPERKFYPEALLECQRYYQSGQVSETDFVSAGITWQKYITFATPMFTVPTIGFSNETFPGAGSAITAGSISSYGFLVVIAFGTGAFAGPNNLIFNWVAKAQL